jgi:hypothetical protein
MTPQEIQEMKIEPSITDFIEYIGSDKKVLVNLNNEWLESFVVGIDIPQNLLKLNVIDSDSQNYIWKELFFQLNKNHPKNFKVKFI